VRILVVVVIIQVRLLKAEEGKVSKATVFGLGLVVSEGESQRIFLDFFFFKISLLKLNKELESQKRNWLIFQYPSLFFKF